MQMIGRFALAAGLLAATGLSAATLDLASEPGGILPAATQQKLWKAYKTAKVCFGHPVYGEAGIVDVPVLSPETLKAIEWKPVFSPVVGAVECEVPAPRNLTVPKPISAVKLDEAYGERHEAVDAAAVWFRRLTTYHRLSGDPAVADLLKQGLLAWANGKGLATGIHVSWGAKPVDYQMMMTIMAFATAAAEIAPDFNADERVLVGTWLNDLVRQVGASRTKDRTDNKEYLRSYLALMWGLMAGDDKPVQEAIFTYKLALHDMRPDGSWPIDSQRGGMGLHYNSYATSQLVMIASLLKQARDIDLFSYAVEGRSIHTAVNWVVAGLQHPGETNKVYAISCAEGGDRFGSIDRPALHYADSVGGYLLAYAAHFPDRESAKYILGRFAGQPAIDDENNGGAPACLFASAGRALKLPPLNPFPPLPAPALAVVTHEEAGGKTGDDPQVSSLLVADILNAKGRVDQRMGFNVQGEYSRTKGEMNDLAFMIAEKVPGKTDALRACGAAIDVWENGEAHLRIEFTKSGNGFVTPNADCVIGALPPKEAGQVRILLHSFRDIAITMAMDGSLDVVRHNGLRDFLGKVAEGAISVSEKRDLALPALKPLAPMPTLPAATLKVKAREEMAHKTGNDIKVNSLILANILNAKGKVEQKVAFNVQADYAQGAGEIIRLSLVMNDPLTGKLDALGACGATFDVWDNGQAHLKIEFGRAGSAFVARNADCIIGALPPKDAAQVKILLKSFRDIAIGMASDGSLDGVRHTGLRDFLAKVAEGAITVSG